MRTTLQSGATLRHAERVGRECFKRGCDFTALWNATKPEFRDALERGFNLERKAARRRALAKPAPESTT